MRGGKHAEITDAHCLANLRAWQTVKRFRVRAGIPRRDFRTAIVYLLGDTQSLFHYLGGRKAQYGFFQLPFRDDKQHLLLPRSVQHHLQSFWQAVSRTKSF